jgi:hypothetical protein
VEKKKDHMTTAMQHYLQHPEAFQRVIQAAMAGDKSVLPEVRAILAEVPAWRKEIGSLVQHTENVLMDAIVGQDLFKREALSQTLWSLKERLAGPEATPLEELLVERIVMCWLQVHHAEIVAAERLSSQSDKIEKRLNGAHRRFLTAVISLAKIRKLAPPVQINIATNQQVNLT